MKIVLGINIIEPPYIGPYSVHLVPVGTFQKGKHSNYRIKIILGSDVVGYLIIQPNLEWLKEPPTLAKEIFKWATTKLDEILSNIQRLEKGEKVVKIKVEGGFFTKAVDVWVNTKTKDLYVKFSDGKIKRFNMLDALKGLETTWAGEILKPDMFDKVSIQNGMPTWPNDFDFDTDVIYDHGVDVSEHEATGSKKG